MPEPDTGRPDLLGDPEDLRHNLALIGRDLDDLSHRDRKSTKGRLSLLHIHAATAVLVGAGLIANGPDGITSPAYAGVRLVPGAPATVGATLAVFGIMLGVATYYRAVRWEITACIGMALFYLLFATSFAVAAVRWQFHPMGMKPSWQGMFSYYGWAGLLIAHLVILRWVARLRSTKSGRSQE